LVFNLYAIDGFKHREIAEHLGISAGTSKSNLARARGHFTAESDRALRIKQAAWIHLITT
jgi:DNA-directed RNA polymerase specialized sigma24 family protein